ncbi:MAG: cellulase family glycosylhydrolase [Verrucomicrobia bacterium]|nr:cellulase family glycosylhydrolase [Verrucomicrobiota bacterium]
MKILVLLCLLVVSSLAAELPEPVLPAGVGVNIHFTRGREADLDLIAAAGFKFIRMDFGWQGIERKKGEYDWLAYDELTANLEKRGLRAIYILDYSSALYEETFTATDRHTKREHKDVASPQHPESVAAFARWAGAAAARFRGRHIIWEIWNEPNISFWKPKPDVTQYTALALATCRAVRAADPQATIVAPATSEFPWTFFESLFASGILKYLDAVSVHPYRHTPPETAAADYLKLRGLIAKYAPKGKENLPIISGEWGYSTQRKGHPLEKQAAYLSRQQLSNLLNGVPLSIWYDWKNDGTDPDYNEHNFGTVDHQLKPKPSYVAVQTMTRELTGYRVARRLFAAGAPSDEDFILLCESAAGDHKLAAWTLGEPHAVALDLELAGADHVTAVNGDGSGYSPRLSRDRLTLDLGPLPKYITLRQRTTVLTMAAAWSATAKSGVLVTAGKPGGAQVRVTLRNPYPEPLRATLAVDGLAGKWPKLLIVALPPQRTVTQEFRGTLHRRDAASAVVTVQAAFQRETSAKTWTTFARSSERVSFVIANPLTLSLVPVADGMRLQVQNPSSAAFTGVVVAGASTNKVSLRAGQREADIALCTQPNSQLPSSISQPLGAQLRDTAGNVVAEIAPRTFRRVEAAAFRAALDGDAKVAAPATIALADAPGGKAAPSPKAFRLDYNFADGWRFVRCVPDVPKPLALPAKPRALGVWVFGDNSGCSLHLRIHDESGQTFQFGGPKIEWTGWRWVTFDLSDLRRAGHWGGANDGVVHGALHWDCPLLLDGRREKTAGTVWFAGLTLIGAD